MNSRPGTHINEDRLVQAAEAAWWAAHKVWNQRGGFRPYPADLMDDPDPPECLRGFTRWEMEQASEFLVRLGMIEKRGQERRRHGRAPP